MFSKLKQQVMKQFTVCLKTGKITGLKIVKGKTSYVLYPNQAVQLIHAKKLLNQLRPDLLHGW